MRKHTLDMKRLDEALDRAINAGFYDHNAKTCPNCGSRAVHCPECGKEFAHGVRSHCDNPACVEVNAPLDCTCGMVVSADLDGVLDFNMKLIPYRD